MARETLAAEFNTFVAGLVTEATPLTFPANASLDEDNFILDRKGFRQRRLGMDLESGAQEIITSISPTVSGDVAITIHRWRNAGGISSKDILVVQTANELKFFDQNAQPLSSGLIHTYTFQSETSSTKFSYAVVDGLLVVATGSKEISLFEFTSPNIISIKQLTLKIRDLFGVEDIVDGVNLRNGNDIAVRPTTFSQNHVYNLRNQTFAITRKPIGPEWIGDPITIFMRASGPAFPSNADSVIYSLYPDANDADDRLTERFDATNLFLNPIGTFQAPRGYFIIDALARGTSRLAEVIKAQNNGLDFLISSLPVDTTPGGATVVTEYGGRVWYGGFSGDVIDGDANSPRMTSYVLFSQLVEDTSDIANCYQEGDPTSKDNPDLVDTDGGFIRIDGAYGICKLVNVGSALMVVAANGVWSITGGSDYGFKATNYMVTKITNRGSESPESLIVVDNSFLYWSDDGIYSVAPNQFGDYEAVNLTRKTIQTLYDGIEADSRNNSVGIYDAYEQKARWVYNNQITGTDEVRELILDLTLGSFYTNSIKNLTVAKRPVVIGGFTVPPFLFVDASDLVTVNGAVVTVNGQSVTTTERLASPGFREVFYLSILSTSPTISYTFSYYRDQSFKDWESVDGVGIDAKAYLITGWLAAGDYQRYKQVPSLTFHFNKTEDGFIVDEEGDYIPTNQSSCKVSARWDWSNSAKSGQWGKSFQAYRFKRHYIPDEISDPYDNGYQTVVTKNKLRGKGKVLSILIETEPEKDCQLLGWSMVMTSNGNV